MDGNIRALCYSTQGYIILPDKQKRRQDRYPNYLTGANRLQPYN